MHPKALLDACAALVQQVLLLQHPADSVVSRFFRQNRSLGPRERATLAETAYTVLRHKLRFEALARSGSGARERRLAILGFAGPRNLLEAALNPAEKTWLKECDAVPEAELLPQHRHNLPQWLAEALQAQLGEQFDALAASLLAPAPLDLRVNTLNAKREAVIKELAAAGIAAEPTPYSPWGLRVQDKPALTKLEAFVQGRIEVQDEARSCWPCCSMPSVAKWWSIFVLARAEKPWRLGRKCATPGVCTPLMCRPTASMP